MKIIFTNLVVPCTSKGFMNVEISELDICLGETSVRIKETLSKEEEEVESVGVKAVRAATVGSIIRMFTTATPEERDRLDFELDLVMTYYNSRYRDPADSDILMLLHDVIVELKKSKANTNSIYDD